MAGEAEAEAVAGEAAARVAGEAKKPQIPEELKPVFDAYANRAAESAAKRAEERVREEFKESARLEKMSAEERQKAETAKLTREVEVLRGERNYLATQSKVQMAVARSGFVPPEIVDAVLRDAIDSGDEIDPDAIAKAASERFRGYIESSGKAHTKTVSSSARAGTPAAVADPNDFSTMTEDDVVSHARSLGGIKGSKYLSDSQRFLLSGGRFAGS